MLEQLSKNYSLVILIRRFTTYPQIILVDNKTWEVYSYKFVDLPMFLKLAAVFRDEFQISSCSDDWIVFWAPRKYKKGLKYLILSLKELSKPLIELEGIPRIPQLIENFEKHRWAKLEREYTTFKLARALKKRKYEGVKGA